MLAGPSPALTPRGAISAACLQENVTGGTSEATREGFRSGQQAAEASPQMPAPACGLAIGEGFS